MAHSKYSTAILTPENVWTASCYDYVHRCNPSHIGAIAETWTDGFKYALKIYTPLFLIPAIIASRKKPSYLIQRTIPNILRSSAFLATLPAGSVPFSCIQRHVLGRHYPISAFISGVCMGLVALLIEHPSRRGELTVFTMNQTAESLFKMAAIRGWVKPVRNANVWIFVVTMTILCYQYHFQRHHLGNIRSILKFILGDRDDHHVNRPHPIEYDPSAHHQQEWQAPQRSVKRELVIAAKSTLRAFFIGIGIRGGIGFITSFIGLIAKVVTGKQKSSMILQSLYKIAMKSFGKKAMQFASFLFLLVGGWRFTLLALRILRGKHGRLNTLIAGAVSGLAMLRAPNTEIAMYFASKAGEGLFRTAVGNGYLKTVPHGEFIVFALGCGVILYCAYMEPFNLRPSYFKFLVNASGGRVNDYEHAARAFCPDWFAKTGFQYKKKAVPPSGTS